MDLALGADLFQIILGLLLGALCFRLCVNFRLEPFQRFVQADWLVPDGPFAAGNVRTGVYASDVGADAVEIESDIAAGMKRSNAIAQVFERGARGGDVNAPGKHTVLL